MAAAAVALFFAAATHFAVAAGFAAGAAGLRLHRFVTVAVVVVAAEHRPPCWY